MPCIKPINFITLRRTVPEIVEEAVRDRGLLTAALGKALERYKPWEFLRDRTASYRDIVPQK